MTLRLFNFLIQKVKIELYTGNGIANNNNNYFKYI